MEKASFFFKKKKSHFFISFLALVFHQLNYVFQNKNIKKAVLFTDKKNISAQKCYSKKKKKNHVLQYHFIVSVGFSKIGDFCIKSWIKPIKKINLDEMTENLKE